MNNGKTNVKNYTDADIIARVESLPTFAGWKKGKYDIWVRSQEDEFDKFDDKAYRAEVKEDGQKPVFVPGAHSGTTNPGAQGLKNFEKYGNERCAVLCADTIVYDCMILRKHKGQYLAYCQDKFLPYYWDDNKNEKSGDVGKIITKGDPIGANNHAAGENSVNIGGWSIACTVRNVKAEFDAMMEWMNGDKYQTRIILNEW